MEKKKNWFVRHKILTAVIIIVVIAIAGSSSSKKDATVTKSDGTTTTQSTSKDRTYRFNDRADKQREDVELALNESGTVDGVKLTVTSAEYKTSVSEYEKADTGKTYIVVSVSLENTDKETHAYNPFDFRVQTAGGQVLDQAFVVGITNSLNSGDLVAGGKVSGSIAFEVPTEDGHQYMIWKPNSADAARAIIELK